MHDPFAAAIALHPELGSTRPATVDVELAEGGVHPRGETDGEHGRGDVDEEGQPQGPVRPDPGERRREPATQHHAEQAGDVEPGVRGDQGDALGKQAWHGGSPRDGIRA